MIRRPPRSTLFPTRRSSDLEGRVALDQLAGDPVDGRLHAQARLGAHHHKIHEIGKAHAVLGDAPADAALQVEARDRKSTRLNSSHANISYAVFCLKKKNPSA